MRIALQPAFVLHSKPFRDTSLLVDLLTLNHGRIHVLARNARGLKSRFKNLVQPFTPLLTSWSGKSDLVYLSQVEACGVPYHLTGDCLLSGFYLNELLVRLLHRHDAHPAVYDAYQAALIGLQDKTNPEKVLRLFELRLLAEIGYGLELQKEAHTQLEIVAENFYRYDAELGFTRLLESQHDNLVFSGKALLALQCNDLQDEEDLRQAKRLLRFVLGAVLGEKPLKSRELFVEFVIPAQAGIQSL
jgi:DNA repair protein RecO (recombination protein O)